MMFTFYLLRLFRRATAFRLGVLLSFSLSTLALSTLALQSTPEKASSRAKNDPLFFTVSLLAAKLKSCLFAKISIGTLSSFGWLSKSSSSSLHSSILVSSAESITNTWLIPSYQSVSVVVVVLPVRSDCFLSAYVPHVELESFVHLPSLSRLPET